MHKHPTKLSIFQLIKVIRRNPRVHEYVREYVHRTKLQRRKWNFKACRNPMSFKRATAVVPSETVPWSWLKRDARRTRSWRRQAVEGKRGQLV